MPTLNERFFKLKENLEPGEVLGSLISQRHNAVRDFIKNHNSTVVDAKLIGSVRRKTRIAPRTGDNFDIDILIIMGSFSVWLPAGDPAGVTAQQALNNLHRTVGQSDRYSALSPQQAPPTITMTYADGMNVEVVPAYIDQIGRSANGATHSPVGRAYWIPKNGIWELADYDFEADYISAQNLASDGWLVPTIKMLKAIRRSYFPEMKSFHLDVMAATIIPICVSSKKQYGQAISYADLVGDFFTHAPQYLTTLTKIPGSHSQAIVMTPAEIASVTDILTKTKNYIDVFNKLPESQRGDHWKTLFGDIFPSA
jgi:Second Messenger Oligonucleotide or Dinucleotide Synthetase domain